MRVDITYLVQVRRDGDDWCVTEGVARGRVTVPSQALAREDGAYAWTAQQRHYEPRCPACAAQVALCVQEITIHPDTGNLLVVHEHDPNAPRLN